MVTAGELFRSLLDRIDPIIVPLSNGRFEKRIAAHPEILKQSVDHAIKECVMYFQSKPQIELAALFLLGRLYRTGTCPELSFIEGYIAEYAAANDDPHLRLLDHEYVPPVHPLTPNQRYGHPILKLMIACLYSDRTGDAQACLEALRNIDDGGGYGATHIVVGAMILREIAGVSKTDVDALCDPIVPRIVAAQEQDRCGDIFAERIVVLQWLGRHEAVQHPFILRLTRGQVADGGWASGPSLRIAKSNQHTSALALVALSQWKAVIEKGDRDTDRTYWKQK